MLPEATTLRLEACEVDATTAPLTLRVYATQAAAPCPLCTTAQRIHRHDERTLADLPWATYRLHLQLRVHKWFCRNRSYHRLSGRQRRSAPTPAGSAR